MPHDAKGNLVKVGDIVSIPAKILQIHQSENFCNVDVEFMYIMPGNAHHERYSALNTRQVIKGIPKETFEEVTS